jgi:hypothetical protein
MPAGLERGEAMEPARRKFPLFRAKRLKASRLRFGKLDARGVPAILLGVSAIVVAAGVSAAIRRGATMLPETLREAREFWLAARGRPPQITAQS